MNRKNLDDLDTNGAKGDWCFLNDDTYIGIRYGVDYLTGTVVIPVSASGDNKNWKWDGNKESPTLSPSILVHANEGTTEGWHGYLRDGKLETV
jgi:hypothetical protein